MKIKIKFTLKIGIYLYSFSYMRLTISLLYSLILDKQDKLIFLIK